MPNHVVSRLTGSPALLSRIVGTDKHGEECVDFDRIIPTPEYVHQGAVACHIETAAEIALGLIDFSHRPSVNPGDAFRDGNYGAAASVLHLSNCTRQLLEGPHVKDFRPEDFETFVAYLRAYRECGFMHGLAWNRAKWGTKWGAYGFERISESQVKFETAWSAPHPVIEKLSEMAGESFKHEWADEDTGNNVGVRDYVPGVGFKERELSGTREGYELCFALHPGHGDDYVLINGKYEYQEETATP